MTATRNSDGRKTVSWWKKQRSRTKIKQKRGREIRRRKKSERGPKRGERRGAKMSLSSAPFLMPITRATIVVVAGANRGIGFEIAHQLAMHGLTVIITSRDATVGNGAAKVLQGGGLNVLVHRLDIVDLSSVESVHLNGYDNTAVVHISWYVVNSMVYLVSSFSFYFCNLQCYAVWYMLNLWN